MPEIAAFAELLPDMRGEEVSGAGRYSGYLHARLHFAYGFTA